MTAATAGHRFWRWALSVDPRATEITSAMAAFGWCITAVMGAGMEAVAGYALMLALAPPWVWVTIVAAVATGQSSVVIYPARHRRLLAADAAAMLWGAIAVLTLLSGAAMPAAGVYATFSVANAWASAQSKTLV